MSANNWSVCPRCKVRAEAEKAAATLRARAAYGTVPAEEYEQLRRAAEKPIDLDQNLREDYELYLNEAGAFNVGYGARCSECDFHHDFTHEEQVEIGQ